MKSIIVGVLVFLLALGGASFFSISKAKSAAAVQMAEAAAADSAAALESGAESGEGETVPDEAGPEESPDGAGGTATDSLGGEAVPASPEAAGAQFASTTLPEAGAGTPEDGPTVPASELGGTDPAGDLNPEGIQRMARIFTAMKPKDAAAVLERMTDLEVRGVMLQMGDRPAAAILSVFDPERAAALSQIVLGRRGAP